jgi:hypothetical protein
MGVGASDGSGEAKEQVMNEECRMMTKEKNRESPNSSFCILYSSFIVRR